MLARIRSNREPILRLVFQNSTVSARSSGRAVNDHASARSISFLKSLTSVTPFAVAKRSTCSPCRSSSATMRKGDFRCLSPAASMVVTASSDSCWSMGALSGAFHARKVSQVSRSVFGRQASVLPVMTMRVRCRAPRSLTPTLLIARSKSLASFSLASSTELSSSQAAASDAIQA